MKTVVRAILQLMMVNVVIYLFAMIAKYGLFGKVIYIEMYHQMKSLYSWI